MQEVDQLRQSLAAASRGERFILQGGDCAERFADCSSQAIARKLKLLTEMARILSQAANKPTVLIGRIAGQYGKPRSADFESSGRTLLPVYRGDNVNSIAADPALRLPDPDRLRIGFHKSALTMNYLRTWANGSVQRTLYTSHEGLLLPYEDALTTTVPACGRTYNLGAHMLWIGDRTRSLNGAHVEYFRGIANPIGVKIGPTADPAEVLALTKILNPRNEAGRLVLITRLGADRVEDCLPSIIDALQRERRGVVWVCDPMHGNGLVLPNRRKTRHLATILREISTTFAVHRECGSVLAGVHLELTGEEVTECLGGAVGLTPADLELNFQSHCDPRLNYSQSLELAFEIGDLLECYLESRRPLLFARGHLIEGTSQRGRNLGMRGFQT